MTRTQEFRFVITPQRAGSFTIPAITVKFDGKEQSTVPISFKVAQDSSGGASGGGQNDGEAKDIFVERELSKTSVYEGEQIVSKIRLHARVRILEAGMNPATAPEFKRVPVEGEKQYQKVINGEMYLIYEVTEILTAQKAGSYKLPPFQFQVKVRQAPKPGQRRGRSIDEFFNDPFFGGGGRAVVKNVRSAETAIEVKPLPTDGRPPQFAGLVGQFQLQASLSAPAGKVGDTVTMTAVLSGAGNLDGIPDLKFDPGANFKTYPDKPERVSSVDAEQGQIGKITWKFALVPLQAGNVTLPAVQVPVFDPVAGRYNVLSVQLPELLVVGGAEAPASAAQKATAGTEAATQSAVKSIGEDLLPWHDLKSRSAGIISRGQVSFGKWLAIVLSLAAVSSWGFAFYKRQDRSSERRASSAAKNFALSRASRGDLAAFRNFLGDKLNLHGGALTGAEVVTALQTRNIDAALVQQVMQSFKNLEASQYSGQSALASGTNVEELVRRLDKEIRS